MTWPLAFFLSNQCSYVHLPPIISNPPPFLIVWIVQSPLCLRFYGRGGFPLLLCHDLLRPLNLTYTVPDHFKDLFCCPSDTFFHKVKAERKGPFVKMEIIWGGETYTGENNVKSCYVSFTFKFELYHTVTLNLLCCYLLPFHLWAQEWNAATKQGWRTSGPPHVFWTKSPSSCSWHDQCEGCWKVKFSNFWRTQFPLLCWEW